MTDLKKRILDGVADDLEKIESALTGNMNPYFETVKKVAEHIIFSGGKRLRPLIMVIASRMCGYKGEKNYDLSVIFEFLHAATLLHDDVVDDANKRRGRLVASKVWDNATAILAGDFLLARSITIAAATGDNRIIKIMSSVTEMMSQGELQQLQNKGRINLDVKEYMKVIEAKTAVLIEGAARCGAVFAGADDDSIERMGTYGINLGIAFQMADDLLDYTTDSETLGKETGIDLKEGKLTLPVIYAIENAKNNGRSDFDFMEKMIKNPDFSKEEFEKFISLLEKHGGIRKTEEEARGHIKKAKDSLSSFGDSKDKELLMLIADYALVRKV